MDYSVKENYRGTNKKIKKIIDMWEALSYDEKLELFCELDEWNHYGF